MLLRGQPVQSPGRCRGRVFQTANSRKWASLQALPHVFICGFDGLLTHVPGRQRAARLCGAVIEKKKELLGTLCSQVFPLSSSNQLRKFSKNDAVESKEIF